MYRQGGARPSEGKGEEGPTGMVVWGYPELCSSGRETPTLGLASFHPLQVQKRHQGSNSFSSLPSLQAESENIFIEFLSQNNLSRFASKKKRILRFLQFSLLSKNLPMNKEVCQLPELRGGRPGTSTSSHQGLSESLTLTSVLKKKSSLLNSFVKEGYLSR